MSAPYFWLGAEADVERPSTRDIQRTVAEFYGVPLLEMRGKYGGHETVLPRQIAMYLARTMTGQSYPALGQRFGGRDHTTVMNAVMRVKQRMANNDDLLADICQLSAAISA